jgi:cell division topological specificity factor
MGFFEFKVGQKKPTPGQVAKERLKVVLVHDRLKISPELLAIIKEEILTVVSQRLDVDSEHMDVRLNSIGRDEVLQTHVPVKRQKVSFDWDPPAYTPTGEVIHGSIHVENEE